MKDAVVSLTCGWFIFLSTIVATCPEWVGTWQARAELAFVVEAENIGLWSE